MRGVPWLPRDIHVDLGFHPLYVVILLALALIIFGPSRLPKMGAQVGRMLREFQAAREGLTQQMRDAFEEEPNFGPSTGPTVAVAEEEPSSEPVASAEDGDAVADRPLGETIAAAVVDSPAAEAGAAEQQQAGTVAVTSDAGATTPEVDLDELAAPRSGVAGPATSEATAEPLDQATAEPLDQATAEPLDQAKEEPVDASATSPAAPVQGVIPEGASTGGVVLDSPPEEPAPEVPSAAGTSAGEAPGTVAESPVAGDAGMSPPPGSATFASVAAGHEAAPSAHDEETRPD
jgi:TatA/E family protein of Tat protein translocase